jgi:hypothetical protein
MVADGAGFLIKAPAFASRMILDISYLDNRFDGWATDLPFTVGGDKAVFSGQDIKVSAFEPGADPVFSQGSQDSILFDERPMWISTEGLGAKLSSEGLMA